MGRLQNETGRIVEPWCQRDAQINRRKTTRHDVANSKIMKKQTHRPQITAATPQESQARPNKEQITTRARAIYEARGSAPGHDLENWLQAESELLHQCNCQVSAANPARA